MKILYVATDVVYPAKKGSSTHTIEVASGLVKIGNQVDVLCRRGRKQPKQEMIEGAEFHRVYRGIIFPIERDTPAPTHRHRGSLLSRALSTLYHLYLRTIHSAYCAYQATQLDRTKEFDVFLERGSSLGAGALAAALRKKPLIAELIDKNHSKTSLITAKKILAYRPDIPKIRIPPDIIVLVPAGANTDLFNPSTQKERHSHYVGYAGSFKPWHGIETIIRAATTVSETDKEARFIMVGPTSDEARELVEELGVRDLIHFTGGVDYSKIPETLSQCSVLLAPFDPAKDSYMKTHGFIFSPLKIFEYMALQRAVVASDVDTVAKVINHNKTGLLVPPGNPEALARATLTLIKNPSLVTRLSKKAREEVCKNYSWQTFCQKLHRNLYNCTTQITRDKEHLQIENTASLDTAKKPETQIPSMYEE